MEAACGQTMAEAASSVYGDSDQGMASSVPNGSSKGVMPPPPRKALAPPPPRFDAGRGAKPLLESVPRPASMAEAGSLDARAGTIQQNAAKPPPLAVDASPPAHASSAIPSGDQASRKEAAEAGAPTAMRSQHGEHVARTCQQHCACILSYMQVVHAEVKHAAQLCARAEERARLAALAAARAAASQATPAQRDRAIATAAAAVSCNPCNHVCSQIPFSCRESL